MQNKTCVALNVCYDLPINYGVNEMFSLHKEYVAGSQAYWDDVPRCKCPHSSESDERDSWLAGWDYEYCFDDEMHYTD